MPLHIAVIGLGRFGSHMAETLTDAGAHVTAIDINRDIVETMRDRVTTAIAFDATDEELLRFHGVDKVEVAVVAIGDTFEGNLLTTVSLKSIGVSKIVSRVASRAQGTILRKVGADVIVNPEDEAAERWANRLLTPHIIEHIELAEGYGLVQMAVPRAWINKTLADLQIRQEYRVNIVAVKSTQEEKPASDSDSVETSNEDETPRGSTGRLVTDVPLPSTTLHEGDILIIAGRDDELDKLPG